MKKYFLRHKTRLLITSFLLTLYSAFQVISAILFTYSTNSLVKRNFKIFIILTALQLVVWLILAVLDYFEQVYEAKLIQLIAVDLRDNISQDIVSKDFAKMVNLDNSKLLSRYTNDIEKIETSGLQSLFQLIGFTTQAIFSIIAMASYHFVLLIVTLILAILMTLGPSLLTRAVENKSLNISLKNEELVSKIKDYLAGINIFFSFNLRHVFVQKVHEESKSLMNLKIDYVKNRELLAALVSFMGTFSQIIIDLTTGLLVLLRKITFGSITSTGQLASNIFYSLTQISDLIIEIRTTKPIFEKNAIIAPQVLQIERREQPCFNQITVKIPNYSIEGKQLYNGLELKIFKGDKIIIFGNSGTGKSTLLKAIAGQNNDLKDCIRLDGRPLSAMTDQEINQVINYLPQKPHIFNTSVIDNLTLWQALPNDDFTKICTETGLDIDLINRDLNDEGRLNVSGGERQRISLARSLINGTQMLLFDEGTANLDTVSAKGIEKQLLKSNLTVVIVSHHLHREIYGPKVKILKLNGGCLTNDD